MKSSWLSQASHCLALFLLLITVTPFVNSQACVPELEETERYQVFLNGQVQDNETGLIWMRCSLGQMWDGQKCSGGRAWYAWFDWHKAFSIPGNFKFAKHSDWRLPTRKELESLVRTENPCGDIPKIDQFAFPDTPLKPYWTATDDELSSDYAWVVNFKNGKSRSELKDNAAYMVRLVRGQMKIKEREVANKGAAKTSKAFREDGIHDTSNPDFSYLQVAGEALAHFSKTRTGSVDWVKTLDSQLIEPRSKIDAANDGAPFDLTVVMARTREMPYVLFQHSVHTEWLTCSNCHPDIFEPKVGANNLSMDEIFKGQQCGRCHGRIAFSPMECERCHSVLHEDSPNSWWINGKSVGR